MSTPTSYINLGPSGGYQPSSTEILKIKENLTIGTSSILNASFDEYGTLTFTDITDPLNALKRLSIKQPNESIVSADTLTTPRAFSMIGNVITTAPVNFDGSAAVVLNTFLQPDTVTSGTIVTNAVTPVKLSVGAPTWLTNGNLSITPSGSIDNNIIIGNKRVSSNSSTLVFQTQSSAPVSSIVNASISRESGTNGNLIIGTGGTGMIKIQTGGIGTLYDRVSIDKDGKVGIGTISPNNKLHIETGPAASSAAIYVAVSTAPTSKRAEMLLGNWSLRQDVLPNNVLDFAIGNVTSGSFVSNLYFGTDGRIGIGTSTLITSTALTVNGTVNATTFVGAVTGTASGNVIRAGSNAITIDASNPVAATFRVGTGSILTAWPISITGNAITSTTATTATTVAAGSITAASLNGAQTGSAPVYGARAFAYATLPDTDTDLVIQSGYNIASIVWISTGNYEITFTNPMPSVNYAVFCTPQSPLNMFVRETIASRTLLTTRIACVHQDPGGTHAGAPAGLSISVFA